MDLRQLEYIVKIAEFENLTLAANALFVSQSTLSLYLSDLEKKLGVSLFTREKKRLHITPAGELYADTARKMLGLKKELYDQLNGYKKHDELRVGLASLYAFKVFSRVLLAHREQFSQLSISITEGRALPMLRQLEENRMDFAILGRSCLLQDSWLTSRLIRRELIVFCMYKNHPLSRYAVPVGQLPPKTEAGLFQNEAFIIPPKETCDGSLALAVLKAFCPGYNILCCLNDTASIIDMAKNEFAITVLPCSVYYSVEALKELYWCRPPENLYRYIQLVSAKSRKMTPTENELFSKIQESYDREHLDWFDTGEGSSPAGASGSTIPSETDFFP
ncbi:MAG: LysR family transcriptional regulator [Eubacteriales bacterium]|nr:LysR family transcriptional regulator [Eubacteriales bacterium]